MGSPSIDSLFAQRVVVGVGDLGVSNNPMFTLSTYGLGSCIAVVAYDPIVKAGGLLHLMLPNSTISPEKAAAQPAMFADTGLPMLFRAMLGLRTNLARLRLFLAGGASMASATDTFRIGERNLTATMQYLTHNGHSVRHSQVGGTINRTVHLNIGTGTITLKTPLANETWLLA